mmetsp:Transcript_61806/g.146250  ORF Transcript_61806/g.146250 Transcript_61806/m.146250 type:complete len:212 (+) Transcript_61806:2287-2922(+)
MQRLHRAVLHGRDSQRALAPRCLRDMDSPQRLRAVAMSLQAQCASHFGDRSVPGFPVHARRSLALILGHSFHGNCLAADRVCQEPLQGFHLVPASFLRCLDDPRLQPPDIAMTLGPVDAVPCQLRVGGRTHNVLRYRIHLLYLLSRVLSCFRQERPSRSGLPFGPGDVATRIRSITERHSLCLVSYTRTPNGVPCGSLAPEGRDTGLPRST